MQDMDQGRASCNASAVDTTYLDVFYPSEPNRESCSDEVSTSWNYSLSVCEQQEGGGEEVVATTGAPPVQGNVSGNQSLVEGQSKSNFVVNGKVGDDKSLANGQKGNSSSG